MPFIHSDVLDNGLQVLTDDVDALHICDSEPATFAEVGTKTLGNKATPTVGAPGARTPSGRKVTVSAITDGEVTGTDAATHWALVDAAGSKLLAAGALSAPQAVTNGNTFTLGAFDVGIPGPA